MVSDQLSDRLVAHPVRFGKLPETYTARCLAPQVLQGRFGESLPCR